MEQNNTRRRFLQLSGGAVVAAAGLGAAGSAGAASADWVSVETTTDNTLHDVETTTTGVYAVGDGGIVIRRVETGPTTVYSTVQEASGGPTGNGNNLYGADVTDDGKRLWFVGSSGVIGEYDVETDNLNSYSAPTDVTNNFNDVAVTGKAGEANVYIASDSGMMYYSFDNGETFDDVTPASGSNINAVDFYDERSGHIVDGDQTVLYTNDGATWDKLGIANANHNFYGVDSDADDDVTVAGGGGTVWKWDGSEWYSEATGGEWQPEDTGDAGLRDVETDGESSLTVGGSGKVFRREGEYDWTQEATPVGENLKAVLRGDLEVAVGASGTVIENA